MKKLLVITAVISVLLAVSSVAQQSATSARIVRADAFLASLDASQRQSLLYDFTDNEQRARWSNFPTGVVPRGGMSFKQMSAPQREAARELIGIVLSPMGLEKVEEIRQADDDFKANGSKRGPGGRAGRGPGGRGPGGDMFGSDLYYISFPGKPSTTTPWMLPGSKGVLTPTLTGAQPGRVPVEWKDHPPCRKGERQSARSGAVSG